MIDSNGNLHYIHVDHLNTPQVVTDDTQTVVWKGEYTPFGEVEEAVSTIEFNLRFPGQFYDAETGLNYNYFRSYDPGTGRYTQSDPIGLNGGLNTYSYTDGKPVDSIDPFGLLEWSGTFKIQSAGIGKIGRVWADFRLESECDMDDMKAKAVIEAKQWNFGPGLLIGSDVRGNIKFEDGRIRVDRTVFDGDFKIHSAGIQIGSFGVGGMSIYIGDLVATEESDVTGLDIGLGLGAFGDARVVSYKVESCGCNQ